MPEGLLKIVKKFNIQKMLYTSEIAFMIISVLKRQIFYICTQNGVMKDQTEQRN